MSKYHKDVSHIKTLDPYRLQELYQMHPCAEHVVKKLLVAGERSGGKSLDTDIADCIWTLQRWQEMRAEDALYAASRVPTGIDATHSESAGQEFVSRYDWRDAYARATHCLQDTDGRAVFVEHNGRLAYIERGPDGQAIQVFTGHNCDLGTLEARPQ